MITDTIMYEVIGYISLQTDTANGKIDIIAEVGNNEYKKDFLGLGDNASYIIEQLEPMSVEKYTYTINYNPKYLKLIDLDYVDQ